LALGNHRIPRANSRELRAEVVEADGFEPP
jgi:hypothetical protein